MEQINLIKLIVVIGVGIIILTGMRLFSRKYVKKSDKIHRRFLGKLLNLTVIIIVLVYVLDYLSPGTNLMSTILKGSAIIVAILGFAAQTAIADVICGFLISMNKPFEIGDRIIVDGIDPGIVEDITLRHTVIRIYDGLRIIVPNSVLNGKTVVNTTRGDERGIHMQFSVSYDTDVHQAAEAIRDCVAASPYTLPVETNGIMEDSGPVYFLKFADSALILETTIWIRKESNSYIAVTDINIRVNEMFKQLGIEIPYNFVNVVERKYTAADSDIVHKKKTAPSKRNYRTDTARVTADAEKLEESLETARVFAKKQRLDAKSATQLELMTEEVIGIMGAISEGAKARLWIDGSGLKYRIHLSFPASVGTDEYKKLLSLSSSGKNEAVNSLKTKIIETMATGLISSNSPGSKDSGFEWSILDEPNAAQIGESLLMALADDIKVTVTRETVTLVVIKTLQQ